MAHFVFHETIVAPASAELAYWKKNDYALDLPEHDETRADMKIATRGGVVVAQSARRSGDLAEIEGLKIYRLDDAGRLVEALQARRATYDGDRWRLDGVRRITVEEAVVREAETATWETDLTPQRFFLLTADPDHTSLPALSEIIEATRDEGAFTGKLRTTFWHRIAGPLSTLLMPLLGAVAGFGLHRGGGLLGRLAFGAALGFSFFVVDNLLFALGGMGTAPPVIAAFAPLAIFLVLGLYMLVSMER